MLNYILGIGIGVILFIFGTFVLTFGDDLPIGMSFIPYILGAAVIILSHFNYTIIKNSDKPEDFAHTQEINVYDTNGNIIKTYKGDFDVRQRSDSIEFTDEVGNNHTIYYTTGTVTIDETPKESGK